jgi:hypothetical protein
MAVAWLTGQHPLFNNTEPVGQAASGGAGVTGGVPPTGTQLWRLASGRCPAGQHWLPATWLFKQH